MKVCIILDLEGVAGVTKFRQNLKSYVKETYEIDENILAGKISSLIRGAPIPLNRYIEIANRVTLVPGVKKISKRTTYFKSEYFDEIFKCYIVQAKLEF